MKIPELVEDVEEYMVVCGACGIKYTVVPVECYCGNGAEVFERIIPEDGFADGGEPYSPEEMEAIHGR